MANRADTTKTRKVAAASDGGAPKKRSYHKGNVADDLMQAAERLLKTETVEDITVRRLTREVGVTPANFYNHFRDLDILLLNIAAKGFREASDANRQIMAKAQSRAEAAKKASVYFVEFAIANKQLFRIMFGQIPNATSHVVFRVASNEGFGDIVKLVYGENRFEPNDLRGSHERCALAYAFWAMLYGLCRNIVENLIQFETGSRQEIRQFVESTVETFIDGSAQREFQRDVTKN